MISKTALKEFLSGCRLDLKNTASRAKFAKKLQHFSGYWDLQDLNQFVQEMRGLDLRHEEDVEVFCQFLLLWIAEERP
jgi:hypothetical protein